MNKTDAKHLLRVAALIDAEAQTWREGFAVMIDGKWIWNSPTEEWAHVRCVKLEKAADFVRSMARKGCREK